MIFNRYKSILLALVFSSFFACKTEVDDFQPSNGQAKDGKALDFTTYVALGNSLTAGYTDNAWVGTAQANSYPQLIANSLQSVGMGAQGFTQPLVSNSGASYFGAQMELVNGDGININIKVPVGVEGKRAASDIKAGQFHNMAVPGIRAVDMATPGYGIANELFGYFSSEQTATVLADAVAANPTFFSMWLGANDVLGYATSGGSYGNGAISSQSDYEASIEQILDGMTSNGAKGVVLNIPNIMDTPLFNFVPSTLEGILALQGLPLNEQTLGLVNSYLAAAFDPLIKSQVEPTVTALVTPSIPADNPQVNVVAAAAQTAPTIGKDPNNPVELSYTVIFLQLTAAGQSPADAMAYLATAEGQAQILELAGIGCNIGWATSTVEAAVTESVATVSTGFKALGYYPVFTQENNQMPIYDENSPTMMVQTKPGAKFTLNAQGKVGALLSLIIDGGELDLENIKDVLPVPAEGEALTAVDAEEVVEAITGYNTYLEAEASDRDLAFLDTKSLMDKVNSEGITVGYTTFTGDYVTGFLFSLDGAHLTQKGYAVIGKFTIDAINLHYGARIPTIETDSYPAVETQQPTPSN